MDRSGASLAYYERPLSSSESQARSAVLQGCGLKESDYSLIFLPNARSGLDIMANAYPFARYPMFLNCLTGAEGKGLTDAAERVKGRVLAAQQTWLNLNIAGSQLSLTIRRKSSRAGAYGGPKGLFAYPLIPTVSKGSQACSRYSLHWISEAQRNGWHVLLDASAISLGMDKLDLSLHRPDYVICNFTQLAGYSSSISCLVFRKSLRSL
ncbi:hypothetical protein CBR_g28759 [Chara braunii]|uniref:Aminotransferase class V domain-containing protein n=1 Tax=Chara braunii TaxID=69332 RepID=A0A388L9Q4_CHABU|nr:hypothetical protein CBR_g28759 [Chara braunii]|eukprot:GBG79045.1 hypothetical protein CBR_g28759 [Chara braunii]